MEETITQVNNNDNTSEYTGADGKFKKGNPGKPLGAVSILAKIKKIFREEPEMFEQYVRDMLKDEKLRAAIMHMIDGMPKQAIEHEGNIQVEWKK